MSSFEDPPDEGKKQDTPVYDEGPIECVDLHLSRWWPKRKKPANETVDQSDYGNWDS